MNLPAVNRAGSITNFEPQRTKEIASVLEAAIQHAKTMEQWEAGWEAVDLLIREQSQFVAWWDKEVAPRGRRNNSDRNYLSVADAENETGISQVKVSRWRKKLAARDKYREALFGRAHSAAMFMERDQHAKGTGENEWYTPEKYIGLAKQVLGEIDLDPASSAKAQLTVGAARYISANENGLNQEWHGRVWLNPPYAQPLISQFVEKLVDERASGNVDAAILLTHNYTDTGWFHKGCEIADAICFPRGRIKFVDGEGNDCAPTQGQAFTYFGEDVEKFAAVFGQIGLVVAPCK